SAHRNPEVIGQVEKLVEVLLATSRGDGQGQLGPGDVLAALADAGLRQLQAPTQAANLGGGLGEQRVVDLRGGEFEAADDVGLLRHFSLIHCLIFSSSPRSTSQARMSIPMAASTRPMSQSSPVHCAPRTVRDHTSPSATAAGIANRPAMTAPTTTPAIRRKYLAGMGSSTVIRTGSCPCRASTDRPEGLTHAL